MAAYNCAAYLPAALDSLLDQTFSDSEFVVVDDASTDETPSILQAYSRRDSRFVLLRNDKNLKLAVSLNRGLAASRAPLIARADADDFCHPERLRKQLQFIQTRPRIGAVSCWFRRIDGEGKPAGLQKLPLENGAIKFSLLWESSLTHAAVLYRREQLLAAGGYAESHTTAQDYELWTRLAERTEFANLPEPLITVRVHADSSSTRRGAEQSRLARGVSKRMLTRYLGKVLADDEAAALRNLLCAYDSLGNDELQAALRLLDELLGQARVRESAATLRWARRAIAISLIKQAYYRTYEDPGGSRKLLRKAAEVSLRQAVCLPAALQVLRLLLAKYRKRVAVPLQPGSF